MSRASKLMLPFILILSGHAAPTYSVPAGPGTPVLIASDEECQVTVDGDPVGTVAAGEVKKIALAPGEHLVSAVCSGERRWRDTLTVGKDQKVVTIPAGSPGTAAPAKPAEVEDVPIGSGCFLLFDQDKPVPAGRWQIGGVIKSGPCDKGGVRPGGIVLSLGGKKAKDLLPEDLEKLDGGPAGKKVTWEVIDREGDVKKVELIQVAYPKSGTVEVLQPEGQPLKTVAYEGYDSMIKAFRGSLSATEATTAPAPNSAPSETPTAGTKRCVGQAKSCWTRPVGFCNSGQGCFPSGSCSGAGQTCFGKSQFTCASTPGCYWMSFTKTCAGTGQTCLGKTEFNCAATSGCYWIASCGGTATPCSSLGESVCGSQPGCSWQ